eukprot:CAMPEP_0206481130 /NCGR_PEP_ID=MMETSP0324_2-20121206/37928_1 /ASSEMBLY_ACC=CAM_ASM_000836 /TAXON_ID=2866 /ORGANISM="Crypthecodinium cohnii, Strain Seligo" /LENGTH=305 /DNA_ID=CAMNT_0053958493 /DNA_START=98 /DNA_END=1015 /DNA_ORIENTATION=-
MAEVPPSLGDFFSKNKKKKIKGVNLNNEAQKPSADEQKASKGKAKDDGDWKDEEQVAAPNLKVQEAGKLVKEEDKKDEHVAPAWKVKKQTATTDKDARSFPTLRKAMGQSSNINIDDGTDGHVNIKTSRNMFDALDNDDEDDEGKTKRPKEIKPFLAQKQKGEMLSSVIQREADKYGHEIKKAPAPTKKKKKEKEASSEEESSEEEVEEATKKKEVPKKVIKAPSNPEEDCKIEPDQEAARAKYQDREKLPKKQLPASELKEEKENKPPPPNASAAGGGGKKNKKKGFMDIEDSKPKVMMAPEGW